MIIDLWDDVSSRGCSVGLERNKAKFILLSALATFHRQLFSRRALACRLGTLIRSPCATDLPVRLQGPYDCSVQQPSDGAYKKKGPLFACSASADWHTAGVGDRDTLPYLGLSPDLLLLSQPIGLRCLFYTVYALYYLTFTSSERCEAKYSSASEKS